MNLCVYIYIYVCRILYIYEFDVKMNLYLIINNCYVYFGSIFFKVKNLSSDES